jgi:protoporphyrinogen oxidase
MPKIAVIIGAGPAGLTAAYELVTRTDIKPIIIEKTDDLGGLSKTVVYKGNRIDIGGHRFFSKSDIVMKWWQNILPLQGSLSKDDLLKDIFYHKKKNTVKLSYNGPDPEKTDNVMLIRNRLSRIFFLRKFFDYPISINRKTILNLGIIRILKIGFSYLWVRIFPIKKLSSLEDFFISRFGNELYKTFFKDYTEKVWGVPCTEIAADWGVQRIKELSVSRTIFHAIKSILKKENSLEQKNVDTSLIEQFMYPKLGPGQMWETVARIVEEKGGMIIKNSEVITLDIAENQVIELTYLNHTSNTKSTIKGDYFFSTMPIKCLISAMSNKVEPDVKKISDGLNYRDFITQ